MSLVPLGTFATLVWLSSPEKITLPKEIIFLYKFDCCKAYCSFELELLSFTDPFCNYYSSNIFLMLSINCLLRLSMYIIQSYVLLKSG